MKELRDGLVLGCFALVFGFFCLACVGRVAPVQIAFYLAFGWVVFLARTLPQVQLNGTSILTAAVCLVGLTLGLYLFLKTRPGEQPAAPDVRVRRPLRWSLAIVGLVVLAFTAGIAAVGISHQVVWLATSPQPFFERGSSSTQLSSAYNLKELGAAAQIYHEANEQFPAGGTFDAQGRAMHGWQTFLLPYIEQNHLYQLINLQQPWDHPDNAAPFHSVVKRYLYPTAEPRISSGPALTHYAGNGHVLGGDEPRSLKQIAAGKGTSNTILAGEAAGNFKPWGSPTNWRDPALGLNRNPNGFGNPVNPKAAVNLLFADGSVRSFTTDTDPAFLQLLAQTNSRK